MKPFDDQQRATIDELVEGVLTSRDAEDARAFVLYAKQLAAFAEGAYALQVERARQSAKYIVLHNFGAKKIFVIKALRAVMGAGVGASALGLKAAKTIVESAPIVLARQDALRTDALHALHTAGADLRIVEDIDGLQVADEVWWYFEGLADHG